MGWRVGEHISIYREEGWYAVHATVVRTPEGDLLVLFHRSPFLVTTSTATPCSISVPAGPPTMGRPGPRGGPHLRARLSGAPAGA